MDKVIFCACVLKAGQVMPAHRDELCRLDMGIGDGDHGVTVERGFHAVEALFADGPDGGGQTFFQRMGDELASVMGGAIGPIYGLFFAGIGSGLGDAAEVGARNLGEAMTKATEKVMRLAKVQPGEKTIVDAMLPASEAMQNAADKSLGAALMLAAEAAEQGAEQTKSMQATKGRARFLKEKSVGYRDAGASSFTLFLAALADAVNDVEKEEKK